MASEPIDAGRCIGLASSRAEIESPTSCLVGLNLKFVSFPRSRMRVPAALLRTPKAPFGDNPNMGRFGAISNIMLRNWSPYKAERREYAGLNPKHILKFKLFAGEAAAARNAVKPTVRHVHDSGALSPDWL